MASEVKCKHNSKPWISFDFINKKYHLAVNQAPAEAFKVEDWCSTADAHKAPKRLKDSSMRHISLEKFIIIIKKVCV